MEKIGRTSTAAIAFLLLLMFLGSGEAMRRMGEEKRLCESRSLGYRGPCVYTNCRMVCMSEGFIDGRCRVVRGCVCDIICN